MAIHMVGEIVQMYEETLCGVRMGVSVGVYACKCI